MAELRRSPAGQPMKHDLRAALDAIGYVTRYGIEWRALPVDFPPWEGVNSFVERSTLPAYRRGLADRTARAVAGGLRPGPVCPLPYR